jgi:hypothetical protein
VRFRVAVVPTYVGKSARAVAGALSRLVPPIQIQVVNVKLCYFGEGC